eukprot:TRINITY_DN28646_c0_g1_i1.p1 TRINITY_DN28646_c0_g1~~TRINITY_DN28646_c0_g1_i1.p1  ORF type:complete len:435 (-),score=81.73 TRINITY_DN28646_c0_g1_i1:23-1327(-)
MLMLGSLRWLWNTVGATCCWALSDIICDTCIGPSESPTPKASRKPSAGDGSNEAEQEKENKVVTAEAKARQRPKARGTQPHPQPSSKTQQLARARLSPRVRPSALLPLEEDGSAATALPPPAAEGDIRRKLSPEQNALVSGVVSLVTVFASVVMMSLMDLPVLPELTGDRAINGASLGLGRVDKLGVLASIGGCFHFAAYLSTLCAFSSVSSTVITPLMQLSAVWMLPLSTLAATLGFASLIRPVHLLSVMLICAGGFLPAAGGHLSHLTSWSFWRQRSIRYVGLGELLLCCYNLVMHQATYGVEADSQILTTLRFFLVSRMANGLTCMGMFAFVPSLRSHALSLLSVSRRFLCAALAGECLSMLGVCLVTFSYSSFYEPSVVNAVEGGLQQLFNLLFAVISHRALGMGRKVDLVHVKIISFLLVSSGLALSTV